MLYQVGVLSFKNGKIEQYAGPVGSNGPALAEKVHEMISLGAEEVLFLDDRHARARYCLQYPAKAAEWNITDEQLVELGYKEEPKARAKASA